MKSNNIRKIGWGVKIGMTQVYSSTGKVLPVSALDLSGWLVLSVSKKDNRSIVKIGKLKTRFLAKDFLADWIKALKKYFTFVREVVCSVDYSSKPGDVFVPEVSEEGIVKVSGCSTGCGFAGVMRRHGYSGAPASHGATFGRSTGSIGSLTACGKVVKGKGMPGRMGGSGVTVSGLKIVKVNSKDKVILVKGSVPGRKGSLVCIKNEGDA